MKKFAAMFKARTMEFIRDRGSFFWNILFPVLFVAGFAIAFGNEDQGLFKIGYAGTLPADPGQESLFNLSSMELISYQGKEDQALEKLRRHQIDMFFDFNKKIYYLNPESGSADLLRLMMHREKEPYTEATVSGRAIRYVDWVIPGIIGMNMMFSCMFGVGFVIVRYRKNGVLKRLKASPVTPFAFISAQMTSRFVIVLLTSLFVFAGTNFFLHFVVNGSYFLLIFLLALTIFCLISLGLIFAARLRNEELATGLLNLITFPMMAFSGIFFSLEGSPDLLQKVSLAFPLTHFLQSARAIMIDGAGFAATWPSFLVLGGMTVLFLGIASLSFKWE